MRDQSDPLIEPILIFIDLDRTLVPNGTHPESQARPLYSSDSRAARGPADFLQVELRVSARSENGAHVVEPS